VSTAASLQEARQRIQAVYDPELIRSAGHRLMDLLADHLQEVESSQTEVLPWCDPPEIVQDATAMLAGSRSALQQPDQLVERFTELVETVLRRGNHLHDPRYIGHQVPASMPLAGLFDAVGSVTNQPMAIYEMGPWATAAEYAMVDALGQRIGWQQGTFSGLVTHGGSLANLTSLLTARNLAIPEGWEKGLAGHGAAPVLVAHADAHYCVTRAAGVLGLGTEQVIRAELDERRRINPDRLRSQLRNLQSAGHTIIAVVACACSTPIGAFDPLLEIADVCQELSIWLHVDAAHGGSACMSPQHRHLVAGLERADSVVWDAHKMLFVPALCAFVFLKNREHRFATFQQNAPYLFDPVAPGLGEFDSGLRTLECTKRAAAFGLWGSWAMFGPELFGDLVDVTFEMGQTLHQLLQQEPDFEPLHVPECNIVVFRHVPPELRDVAPEKLGQFQLELRRRLIESGDFYIVSTKIDGVGALRVTIINPLTTTEHLEALLHSLRQHGKQLLA
jgi:L-2,4-diaminobutyrate decarboxylase